MLDENAIILEGIKFYQTKKKSLKIFEPSSYNIVYIYILPVSDKSIYVRQIHISSDNMSAQ